MVYKDTLERLAIMEQLSLVKCFSVVVLEYYKIDVHPTNLSGRSVIKKN